MTFHKWYGIEIHINETSSKEMNIDYAANLIT